MSNKPFALVIGASSGIGYAVADFLLDNCRVITAQRNSPQNYPMRLHSQYVLDVRKKEDFAAIVSDLQQKGIRLKYIVYCTGIAHDTLPQSQKHIDDITDIVDVNSLGLVRSVWFFQQFLSAGSRFVSVGSLSETKNYFGGAEYCASKAFNLSYMKAMRLEFMRQGVQFCTVSPGMTDSDFHKNRYGSEYRAEQANEGIKQMKPDEVARIVEFVLTCPENICVPHITVTPHDQAEHGEDIRKYKFIR